MPRLHRPLAVLGLICAMMPTGVGAEPSRSRQARLCPDDAPEGVRLPPRSGCPAAAEKPRLGENGFREVGGVTWRIGGRVGADYDLRR